MKLPDDRGDTYYGTDGHARTIPAPTTLSNTAFHFSTIDSAVTVSRTSFLQLLAFGCTASRTPILSASDSGLAASRPPSLLCRQQDDQSVITYRPVSLSALRPAIRGAGGPTGSHSAGPPLGTVTLDAPSPTRPWQRWAAGEAGATSRAFAMFVASGGGTPSRRWRSPVAEAAMRCLR